MNKQPTTVRGWLETLPEPLRGEAIQDAKTHNYGALESCNSLSNALYAMYLQCGNGKDFYWHGVRHFVLGRHVAEIDEDEMTPVFERGYNAAKAAYEAQEKRKSEVRDCCRCGSTLPETEFEGFEQTCNDCLKFPAYQVKEVWGQVEAKELAELREKAAKWDELMETIERLRIC